MIYEGITSIQVPHVNPVRDLVPTVMTNSSSASPITLRPRNRHQFHDNEQAPNEPVDRALTPSPSRNVSPNLRTHSSGPSEPSESSQVFRIPGISGVQVKPPTFATNLWQTSWSSLQDIASTIIGHDDSSASSLARDSRKRRPVGPLFGRNTSAPPAQWGPSMHSDHRLGVGTQEDNRALLQARKREALLTATGHTYQGNAGRHKRRNSDDRNSSDVHPHPYENEDIDALVYLHKVRPQDTLAGIMIKYNCDTNTFRKANRMWPNDSIQSRRVVVLPVDACGVKGRKIPPPDKSDMMSDAIREPHMLNPTSMQVPWADLHDPHDSKEAPSSSYPASPSISISLSNPEEPPWKHDSWVTIDGCPDVVEIGRLPRRTLGYFPRGRRKSLTFSDLESPSASFDLSRGSYQCDPSQSSITSKSRSSSGSFLQGPGGVGTMGRNVRSPGPAQDGLNKIFAKHLPDIAPRSSLESLKSESSHTTGIDHIGGAVEGWVRKLATRAASTVQPVAAGENVTNGVLIELSETTFHAPNDEEVRTNERFEGIGDVSFRSKPGTVQVSQQHDSSMTVHNQPREPKGDNS